MAKKATDKQADRVEWIIAIAGMVLLAAAVGSILYRAISEDDIAPKLSVTIENIEPVDNGHRVDFKVSNSGSQTAAAVTVVGKLTKDGEDIEESTAALTYVPAHSSRTGGMFFTHDPKINKIELRPTGFEKP